MPDTATAWWHDIKTVAPGSCGLFSRLADLGRKQL